MTTKQATEFNELLKTWNAHQDLRQQGAPVAQLFESRAKLDEVRVKAYAAAA